MILESKLGLSFRILHKDKVLKVNNFFSELCAYIV